MAHAKVIKCFIILTAWKVSKYGVFSGPYLPVSGLNTESYGKSSYSVRIQENTDEKKLRIWALFTQWLLPRLSYIDWLNLMYALIKNYMQFVYLRICVPLCLFCGSNFIQLGSSFCRNAQKKETVLQKFNLHFLMFFCVTICPISIY